MDVFFALFVIMLCGLLAALILLIVGLCLRRRSVRKSALIVFVCSCVLMFTALLFCRPGPLRRDNPAEIDEVGKDYFWADGTRYEAIGYKSYSEIHSGYSPREFYYKDGWIEHNFYCITHTSDYFILKNDFGDLYCSAEEKEEVIAALTDPDNVVWYGRRDVVSPKRLDISLVDEVLAFCESAEGTEEITREDGQNIILTKTGGGIIVRENISLLYQGGAVYYEPAEDGAMAPLPADLSNRLITALDE